MQKVVVHRKKEKSSAGTLPEGASGPAPVQEKKRRGAKPGTKREKVPIIKLAEGLGLSADPYCWTLHYRGLPTYYTTLTGALTAAMERKVRESHASDLQELADAIVQAQAWIQELLKPFSVWDGGQIHSLLAEDFRSALKVRNSQGGGV